MKFYLSTFLQAVLLLATLMAVWARWDAWRLDPREFSREGVTALYPRHSFKAAPEDPKKAPDGRFITMANRGDSKIYITLNSGSRYLLYDFWTEPLLVREFIGNDTLLVIATNTEAPKPYRLFFRRHPEEWWGHFYRPEVWASIALFFSLVIHLVHARKQRNAGH